MKILPLMSFLFLLYINNVYSEISENSNVPFNEDEHLFKQLFKKRRLEQLNAVNRLIIKDGYEKQFKMVTIIASKIFNVVQNSRVILESSGYIPGISIFPKNETILDALSNILENTVLFADIILRLPDISHEILDSNHEWLVLYEWSLEFVFQTLLLDNESLRLIHLVKQELNITEKTEDFINPYIKTFKIDEEVARPKEEKKKKRKEIKRGPRLSERHTEL